MANLDAGQAFGPYELTKRLARGGMGEIWLAEQKGISGFSKQVVIKTILENFIDEPELVRMFLDEGRIAAGLHHPAIAQTYDLGQVGETYYIAMEYVHGHDVRDILLVHSDRGQLVPLNLVLRIGAQVCEGLYYAHHWKTPEGLPGGLVHRDISPQNIIVTFDGMAKIIDFGIARAMSGASRTRSGVIKGKCAYMSPEQIRSDELDGRSDLFALGVVMFEMITGRRLFKRDSEMATLDAVVKAQIPPPTQLDSSVPGPVEKLVLTALQRDRRKRFQDAREMQLATEDVMQETGLLATSAHLSSYMHKIFSQDDWEANRERLREAKRRGAAIPGVRDEGPKLERTAPFQLSPGSLPGDKTGALDAPTRNLLGTRARVRQRRRGLRAAGVIALLLAVIALSIWWLWLRPEPPLPVTGDGGPQAADAGAVAPALDAGTPATSGDAAGATPAVGGDPTTTPPPAADRGKPGPRPGDKKKRKKKTDRPDKPGDSGDPLDIKLER